jgi:hypothetical protein
VSEASRRWRGEALWGGLRAGQVGVRVWTRGVRTGLAWLGSSVAAPCGLAGGVRGSGGVRMSGGEPDHQERR